MKLKFLTDGIKNYIQKKCVTYKGKNEISTTYEMKYEDKGQLVIKLDYDEKINIIQDKYNEVKIIVTKL